jgi:uncharacterized membrane protein YedE/YeeE
MTNFTPVSALVGGALIGGAALLLWLANGRIAGVSGIVGALLQPRAGDIAWRLAFLVGMLSAPLVYAAVAGGLPQVTIAASPLLLAFAGFLVGFGTRLGGGCTSGHGVCGTARLSPRSLTATATFMGVAIVTVFIARHVIGG